MANKAYATLLAAVEKAKNGTPSNTEKENFYYPERDKAGNGFAVIRFLPGKTDDDVPFVKTYSHGFKNKLNNKWYIEDCPTTIGENCPACEANSVLWNSGVESNKDIVRERKRKLSYIANILVVSDTKNPENEGKVFLFKFGQKIFDKIVDQLQPEVIEGDEPREPVNVFDPVEGANFKFRIRVVEGYANYDKSEFDKPAKIDGNLKDIMEGCEDINRFVAPEKFKKYDDLAKRLNMILGVAAPVAGTKEADKAEDNKFSESASKAPASKPAAKDDVASSDDDDLDYFRRLAAED